MNHSRPAGDRPARNAIAGGWPAAYLPPGTGASPVGTSYEAHAASHSRSVGNVPADLMDGQAKVSAKSCLARGRSGRGGGRGDVGGLQGEVSELHALVTRGLPCRGSWYRAFIAAVNAFGGTFVEPSRALPGRPLPRRPRYAKSELAERKRQPSLTDVPPPSPAGPQAVHDN